MIAQKTTARKNPAPTLPNPRPERTRPAPAPSLPKLWSAMLSWQPQRIHQCGAKCFRIRETLLRRGASHQELHVPVVDQRPFPNPPYVLITLVAKASHQRRTPLDGQFLRADAVGFLARPAVGVGQVPYANEIRARQAAIRRVYIRRTGIKHHRIAAQHRLENMLPVDPRQYLRVLRNHHRCLEALLRIVAILHNERLESRRSGGPPLSVVQRRLRLGAGRLPRLPGQFGKRWGLRTALARGDGTRNRLARNRPCRRGRLALSDRSRVHHDVFF